MIRIVRQLLAVIAGVFLSIASPAAQKPAASAAPPKIDACSLLTKAEVKEFLPWPSHVDQLPATPEDMGATGSACEYVTVRIQLLPYSRGFIDAVNKTRKQETITGVGDEAYISANRSRYVELAAKVGPRILTLQASIPTGGTYETTKPKTIALAKALVAKLSGR